MLLGRYSCCMEDKYENFLQNDSNRNKKYVRTTLQSSPVARIDLVVLYRVVGVDLQLVDPHSV